MRGRGGGSRIQASAAVLESPKRNRGRPCDRGEMGGGDRRRGRCREAWARKKDQGAVTENPGWEAITAERPRERGRKTMEAAVRHQESYCAIAGRWVAEQVVRGAGPKDRQDDSRQTSCGNRRHGLRQPSVGRD